MVDMGNDLCHEPVITVANSRFELCAPCGSRSGEPQWFCFRTGYAQELTADIELRVAGFEVFNPSVFKVATRPRRDINGVIRPGLPDRIVPLFARYGFVRFVRADRTWRRIRGLRGVDYLFTTDLETPIPIPDRVIDRIRAKCASNDCIYPPKVRTKGTPLEIGTAARLSDGLLSEVDLDGLVDLSDGKRVTLLITIMGHAARLTTAQANVEAIADRGV